MSLFRFSERDIDGSTVLKSRKHLLSGLLFILAIGTLFVWSFRQPVSVPDFLKKRTEGYEHFLAAAEEIAGKPGELTNGFAEFVTMNQRAYEAIDRASKEEIEAPASAYSAATNNFIGMVSFVKIGEALLMRSKAAELDEHWDDAVMNCLDTIGFGQKVERGPMFNFLVGSAIELKATKRLEELAPRLSETNLARATPKLRELNRERIPYSEVERRERYFLSQVAANPFQVVWETFSARSHRILNKGEEMHLSTTARMEVLATVMAARRFELNQKSKLTSFSDLMPSFLDSKPIDPYSKAELKFKRSGEEFVIYSVGPNGRDESGKGDDIAMSIGIQRAKIQSQEMKSDETPTPKSPP